MKKLFLLMMMFAATPAFAADGSWFAVGANYEHLASGGKENGVSINAEGGYWYLGNVAYGGSFKASFFGDRDHYAGSKFNMYDLGAFWKAGTEQGLYGKLVAGLAFMDGDTNGLRTGDGTSFYVGLGGGFLFPITETFQIGPEVLYRHLTAGDGADQISVGALVAYSF